MRTTPTEVIDRYRRQGWWTDTTVDDLFRAAAAADRGRTAVIDPANRAALGMGEPQRLSYADLESRVDAIAAQLLGLGLRRGDIVLVQLPNVWEGVALYLATARLGLVLSPVAMQYRHHELEQIGRLLQPRAVVTCREFKGFDHAALWAGLAKELDAKLLVAGYEAPAGALQWQTGPATEADRAAVAAALPSHRPWRTMSIRSAGHRGPRVRRRVCRVLTTTGSRSAGRISRRPRSRRAIRC